MVADPLGVVLVVASSRDGTEHTQGGDGDAQAGHRAIVAETDIVVQRPVHASLRARACLMAHFEVVGGPDRSPASVTVTSRRTAAFDRALLAAVSA
jgi:hypothetical protein